MPYFLDKVRVALQLEELEHHNSKLGAFSKHLCPVRTYYYPIEQNHRSTNLDRAPENR